MTSAARPTFAPAIGSDRQGGNKLYGASVAYSSRDLPGHLSLKTRRHDDEGRDLKQDLEERERRHYDKKRKDRGEDELYREKEKKKEILSIADLPPDIDADDEDGAVPPDDDSDSEISDDDDDEAELMAELEKIKRERAEEQAKKERERLEQEQKEKQERIVGGNPLLNLEGNASFGVKRRWDDDVVFRNQARGEPEDKKRFINDPLRNDFHKRFLSKYIK
eukprot:TRINITY_DN1914_c0_g1::TRINITY_DN1914_c0_g1_i1::g.23114::m.23114 TRINITY_DN1914_c0_g1::TRINITY_DN1914_c0_g1_i1::g.23114  ORF type:complete len:221 (+),score=29.94,sp/Q0VFP5/CWC15_XENTR/48.28/3e-42,Cwf_Cwc_15/PF04889.7/1.7e-67 TRINITY_DN1914_c0_g1_i1:101-763(+)